MYFPKNHPNIISIICKKFIRSLLIKNEFKRLGSSVGAADLKHHPFFKGTNWALLRNQTPPIIPTVEKNEKSDPLGLGLRNFRSLKEENVIDFNSEEMCIESSFSNPFHAFESISISRISNKADV